MGTVGMVLVAAGSGERLGATVPKALVEVAGRPLVAHAAAVLLACAPDRLVVVAPPDDLVAVRDVLPDPGGVDVAVVAGGATRAASVRAGLAALGDAVDLVAVHDAARAFAPVELVRATLEAVVGDVVAAAPGLPVGDTLKQVDDGTVVATVDRSSLRAVQTPQVFRADVLRAAHAGAPEATDDLALVEALLATGAATGRVVVVPGRAEALKVTWPHDLRVAELVATAPAETSDGGGRVEEPPLGEDRASRRARASSSTAAETSDGGGRS